MDQREKGESDKEHCASPGKDGKARGENGARVIFDHVTLASTP